MNYKSIGTKIGLAAFVSISALTVGATTAQATDVVPYHANFIESRLVADDNAKKETLVTTDYLNVRAESNTNSRILGVLNIGTTVEGVRQGEWVKIRYNGQNAFVNASWLKAPAAKAEEKLEVFTRYTTDNLNVRSGEGTSFNILGVLPQGTKVEGSYVGGEWFRISYNGRTGYVHKDYLHWTTGEEVSTAPQTDKETQYTTAYLNVRKGPGTNHGILGVLNPNKALEGVYEGHWFKIQYAGQTAYVSGTYLSAGESNTQETAVAAQSQEKVTKYTTANLNVRTGASTKSKILGVLSTGTEVSGVSNNGWFQIEYNGSTAFVSESYLTENRPQARAAVEEAPVAAPASDSATIDAIIRDAKAQVGKRYVYGTAGPNTFDCSGLTYYLYKKHAGVTLPRSSASQATAGTTVSKSDMKPGDLIFFINPGASRIGHVAIYVGGGQYVHASTPATGVKYDSTSGNYFNRSAVLIKRILP